MSIYHHYSRDRVGWVFGLSGWQVVALAATFLPLVGAIRHGSTLFRVSLILAWLVWSLVVVIPVRGRSAAGWLIASVSLAVGASRRWTHFDAHITTGRPVADDLADLPGLLHSIEVHDGPATGSTGTKVAIIQNHATRSWAVTAGVVHPGIGLADREERDNFGAGLAALLEGVERMELVSEVLLVTRSVPEDGAERDVWVKEHRSPAAPDLTKVVTNDLAASLTRGSVRTEQFVTLVVPEARLRRPAREAGGGLRGRVRELELVMDEVEAHLRGAVGMLDVQWLTGPALALACRSGFAPGDRLGVVEALADAADGARTDVPWCMAGPSGADAAARHYSHDAWNSVSVAVSLPPDGVVMGALAPVLTPTEPGERRSLVVALPVVRRSAARRRSANAEWAADTSWALRSALGVKTRAQQREVAAQTRDMDEHLARGHAMVRPYAVATVTVPKTVRVAEYGRRLDASVRRSGFAPMRLDLCHDAAFAASVVPLGVSLTRGGLT